MKRGFMRKICLIVWAVLLSGCATVAEMGTHMNNVDQAVMNRKNLVGMTKEELVKEFGSGSQTSASYNGPHSYEHLTYKNTNYVNNETMNVTLVDNIVQNVSYN